MTLLDLTQKELSTITEIISHEIEQGNFKQNLLKSLLAKFEKSKFDEEVIAGICSICDETILHDEDWEFSSVGAFLQRHTNCQ